MMLLEPGTVVAGKLRIERVLGQGGMGTVYVATHIGLDQQVAVKVLDATLAQQGEVVQRFVREARASAQLKSDHVCRVMDVGALEDGVPYIEMELLDGEDLGQLIARAPLAPDVAAEHVLQACVAIAEAHARGIVHRDLKPANLFVTRRLDGTALVKVLDFGIATAPSSQELKITKTTAVMGSPGYMSPEHLRSARDVDARSDIWALGVILYEAVSGTLPFVAQTITELAVKVVMDEPEPLVVSDPAYAAVVARCLAKDPALRYQNIAELAMDLMPIAGGEDAQHSAFLVAKIAGPSTSMPVVRPPTGQVPVEKPKTGPGAYAATAMGVGSSPNIVGAAVTQATGAKLGTTLGSSAGASLVDATPPKKNRGALIAVAVIVLGGGAAAAVALTRGDHTPKHHHDEKVATLTPSDAAIVTPDAAAAVPTVNDDKLLLALGGMNADQNWKGIIRMANVDTANDEIKQLVATAKTNFTKEQTAELGSYARRHDCTSAKRVLAESEDVLPEQKAAFEQAAACTAAPAPTPTVDLATQASKAFDKGAFPEALTLAVQALAKDSKNETALDVAARAVCATGDKSQAAKARPYLAKLDETDRAAAGKFCREHGMVFDKPNAPPRPKKLAEDDVGPAEQSAKQLVKNRNWAAAEVKGLSLLDYDPNNVVGLRAVGISACMLGHAANVDRVLNVVERNRNSLIGKEIRNACRRNAPRGRSESPDEPPPYDVKSP